MKITVIADCHLNRALYKGIADKDDPSLSFRTADFLKAFESIIKTNIEDIKPDLIVINGDVFDSFDPANNIRAFLYDQLRQLIDAKIPVIILVGNHDVCRKHHPLKPLLSLDLKTVKIIESPRLVNFKNHVLMIFPYSMEVEQGKVELREQFLEFVESSKKKIKEEGLNKEILFFGHFPVKGAKINTYSSAEDPTVRKSFYNKSGKDISLADLDTIGAKYVFLGDFHQFQILETKKCIAMYSGSIEKTDMSEIDQRKGFVVYDDEAEEIPELGKCRFIEYGACRPMIDLRGTSDDIIKSLDKLHGKMKGAIVKISFIGDEKQLEEFSLKLDSIKTQINRKIQPVHMFHEQKVTDEEQEKEAARIEEEILEHGHASEQDVTEAVSEMIKEKEKDVEEQNILIAMASEIYKETMEEK